MADDPQDQLDQEERDAYKVLSRSTDARELLDHPFFLEMLYCFELEAIQAWRDEEDPEEQLKLWWRQDAAAQHRRRVIEILESGIMAEEELVRVRQARELHESGLDTLVRSG